MKILGISCSFHDSAACLLDEGRIVAAAQEERFTRIKHDSAFPSNAVKYCLSEAGISGDGLDKVVFYEKPILKFHRIMETYFSVVPKGLRSFLKAVPGWLQDKLWLEPMILGELRKLGLQAPEKLYYSEHHESHAASAFYPSPFESAAIVTLDGVGEWSTTTLGVGEGNKIKLLREIRFPHSLGLLYSAFTYFTGFRVNSGEYKLMGLAPYGRGVYTDIIKEHLVHIKEDGSFCMNLDYFGYLDDLVMTNRRFADLFGGPRRAPETPITQREMDLAKSVQEVTEEIVLAIAREARRLTGQANLCLAGGVALNCVANGKLLRENIFDDIWIQPAAGDAGGALGAAQAVWYNMLEQPRVVKGRQDSMQGAYLGPEFSRQSIQEYLDAQGCVYTEIAEEEWADTVAELLAKENVIGLFQGRMEYGPRALGNRSILGDARSQKMQSIMNLKIKYRESFRPFAPSVLEERVSDFFELERPSPYMLLVAPVQPERCMKQESLHAEKLIEWVNTPRSDVPAITHVDYSARVQTVSSQTNPRYHSLLRAFEKMTGYGILINTSFNVRGEPIVCTPEDAYRCFMRTEMDYLCLGPFLLEKKAQKDWEDTEKWQEVFKLD